MSYFGSKIQPGTAAAKKKKGKRKAKRALSPKQRQALRIAVAAAARANKRGGAPQRAVVRGKKVVKAKRRKKAK